MENGENIVPTQCIVNRYLRGEGISAHTDAKSFGPVIVSISLEAPTNMIFTHPSKETISLYLPRRSILILTGEARDTYKHEIPSRVTIDLPDRVTKISKPLDYRRISLTYRTLI